MSKEIQKKCIEINHALSGYHGETVRKLALSCFEARKDILKKLERKKKLAAVISDELYSYLEKFPEEVILSIIRKWGCTNNPRLGTELPIIL